jgi:hypothetical protein
VTPTTSAPAATTPTTADAPATPQTTFRPVAVQSGEGRPWGRLLLYVPVCAGVAYAVAYARTRFGLRLGAS